MSGREGGNAETEVNPRMARMNANRSAEMERWPKLGADRRDARFLMWSLRRERRFAPEAWEGCGEPSLPFGGGRDAHAPRGWFFIRGYSRYSRAALVLLGDFGIICRDRRSRGKGRIWIGE